MKILLLGEYSNLHNSLKKGLVELGHKVTLISSGDGFKSFESDILFNKPAIVSSSGVLKKLFTFIFRYPFSFYLRSLQFQSVLPKLKDYDFIQLVNEHAIGGVPWIEKRQLKRLKKQNKHMVLLCCGEDYNIIHYCLNSENLKYSNLTPLLEDKSLTPDYAYSLKYITPSFKKLSKYIEEVTIGTIASDMDYHLPLQSNSNYLGMIPNPIALSKKSEGSNQKKGTTILLGINTNNYTKKGLKYFDEALTRIEKKYPNVIIKKTTNLPFKDYMAEVKKADILLDQIYCYDQGYNALQAMAFGKVVFTGAEQAFLAYYNLKEDEVAINALPDVDYLVHKLSSLIESPKKTKTIGANAKAFVLKHHKAKEVAKKYVETWINAAQ